MLNYRRVFSNRIQPSGGPPSIVEALSVAEYTLDVKERTIWNLREANAELRKKCEQIELKHRLGSAQLDQIGGTHEKTVAEMSYRIKQLEGRLKDQASSYEKRLTEQESSYGLLQAEFAKLERTNLDLLHASKHAEFLEFQHKENNRLASMNRELESKVDVFSTTVIDAINMVKLLDHQYHALNERMTEVREAAVCECSNSFQNEVNTLIEKCKAYEAKITRYEAVLKDLEASLTCPLSLNLIQNPAFTAHGQLFEYRSIVNWLKRKKECPTTGLRLTLNMLLCFRVDGDRITGGPVQVRNICDIVRGGLLLSSSA